MREIKTELYTRPVRVTDEFIASHVKMLHDHGPECYEDVVRTILRKLNVLVEGRSRVYYDGPVKCAARSNGGTGGGRT